jgi:uncharacterized protein YjbI with pentapeptide repeats
MPLCPRRSLGARLRVHRFFGDQPRRWRLELFLGARRTLGTTALLCLLAIALSKSAYGDIYYNSASPNAGQVIPGTQGIAPGPGIDLSNWNTSGHVLTYASLSNFNLANANFQNSALAFASFASSNLTGANLANAFLGNADFSNANLTEANFVNAYMQGVNLTGATIKGTDFNSDRAPPFGLNGLLTTSQLQSTASYASGDLSRIRLGGCSLDNLSFDNMNVSNSYVVGGSMGGSFVNANFSGADFTNSNLEGLLTSANLSHANFTGARLTTNLTNANCANANFTNANLQRADFSSAILTGAIIKGANFSTELGDPPLFTASELYSTGSFANHDLTGIQLNSDELQYDLSGWNFAHQNLTNASFRGSNLTNADLAGAIVNGTDFSNGLVYGGFGGAITAAQLYSTASYSSNNLSGIKLVGNVLVGWNFASQNLTSANFNSASLSSANFHGAVLQNSDFSTASLFFATVQTNTDYTDADLRGATGWTPDTSTITHDTIRPDGSIQGLALLAGERLVVRNNPLAVTVTTSATFDSASMLSFMLSPNWASPMRFSSGLTPTLGGTLDLELATGANPAALIGDTFQLFNWSGPLSTGDQFSSFTTAPGLTWDLTNLYSTGTVTLTGVPEPSTALMVAIGLSASAMLARRRKCG